MKEKGNQPVSNQIQNIAKTLPDAHAHNQAKRCLIIRWEFTSHNFRQQPVNHPFSAHEIEIKIRGTKEYSARDKNLNAQSA